jgi:tetratricopeptide (TPR) repeat protein
VRKTDCRRVKGKITTLVRNAQIPAKAPSRRIDLAICLALLFAVFAVYAQTAHFDFVNYDDDLYIYENPQVQAGVTLASLKWAMTAVVSSNWMPVTLISHMLDAQFFGIHAGPQHLVNAALHALAALVLFLLLLRITQARWPAAFVAFVFALHPLHVSSVAWLAERKDVLSTLLWFLTTLAWVRYTEKPERSRYLVAAVLFALGLMAKPMLVTLPFTLLLLDVWPLRRFTWPKALIEKLPLFALAFIAALISYLVQDSAGAVKAIPFVTRLENALISYAVYIGQTFWPAWLSVFYPYPRAVEAWQAAAALLVILAVSAIVIRAFKTAPWFAVGWFWYLGTLVPVIGLVQVGMQSHADRYTYVPMIGLTIMLAWGAAQLIALRPALTRPLIGAAALVCIACLVDSTAEAAYWKNSETLFRHALENTSGNWLAEYNLGHYLMDRPGRASEAIPHFEAALRILPDDPEANNNLGTCLMNTGRYDEAAAHFQAALQKKPSFTDARFNLGLDYMRAGRTADAIHEFEATIGLNPAHQQAQNTLGVLLAQLGRPAEAIPHLEAAVRIRPDASSEQNLGVVLASIPSRRAEGVWHLQESNRLHPDARLAQLITQLQSHR